jgi:hypothetical protein
MSGVYRRTPPYALLAAEKPCITALRQIEIENVVFVKGGALDYSLAIARESRVRGIIGRCSIRDLHAERNGEEDGATMAMLFTVETNVPNTLLGERRIWLA